MSTDEDRIDKFIDAALRYMARYGASDLAGLYTRPLRWANPGERSSIIAKMVRLKLIVRRERRYVLSEKGKRRVMDAIRRPYKELDWSDAR